MRSRVMSELPDEFEWIARVLAPLAKNASEAFDLADDAAAVPARPGFDLIITKDAIVEGVHFLADDAPDLIARKLLRMNLSDLAAKGADPYGYFLAIAWPARFDGGARDRFAAGLAEDQARYGLNLFGGDTTATPGPLVASATLLGWVPAGGMVRRAGGKPGDTLLVTGAIGDGWLGLQAARGELEGISYQNRGALAARYRLPEPRLGLGNPLREWAHAAADVSDGLVADAGHIASASGLGLEIDLDRMPLSEAASAWLERAPVAAPGRVSLATGGDDYEIVCAVPPANVPRLTAAVNAIGLALTEIGTLTAAPGVRVLSGGRDVDVPSSGYVHR
jgi:thiamine-monophosphate kinase